MDADGPTAQRRTPPSAMAIALAAGGILVLLWFVAKTITAILLLFLALTVAIALSAPIGWLVARGLGRRAAAAAVLGAFFAAIGLVAWLVIPRVAAQVVELVNGLPQIIGRIDEQIALLLDRHPELQSLVRGDSGATEAMSATAMNLFRGVGGFSLSVLGATALAIIFLSTVIYVVLDPRPILTAYLGSLPQRYRRQGMRAYRRAARAVIGWTEASLIVGAIEFVAVFAFLSWMEVPGALVWAALAFFAEFIPRLGGYIMAFPPIVVALTLGPATALWVALFYLAMNELLGNLVAPRIRGTTMRIHPVMLLFFTLAFALAFGVLGAVVATPAAAFFSAYWSEFYMKRSHPAAAPKR